MEATKNGIVGREVYDKKQGLMGRVVKEDGLQITIEFNDGDNKVTKTVTPTTFKRWYRLLDEDGSSESGQDNGDQGASGEEQGQDKEPSGEPSDEGGESEGSGDEEPPKDEKPDKKKREPKPKAEPKYPSGEPGSGGEIARRFRQIVDETANQDVDYGTTKDPRVMVVRYNGRNAFEVTVCKRRVNVLCHKKSLSPDNLKRATKVMPDAYGWPLSVQFTFTDLSENSTALMRSIVTDGLYYRQKVETEEPEKGAASGEEG